MIFKRRKPAPLSSRVREFLAPRKGFWRGWGYIGKRIRRLPDSPHRIALGFACGALASFTPFFGFHFFVAAGLAWIIRANMLSALFGTIVGNPLTFPFISGVSLWFGRWIMGRSGGSSGAEQVLDAAWGAVLSAWSSVKSWFGYGPSMLDGFLAFLDEVFLPYLIGGLIPGFVTGVLCYVVLGPVVAAYQERRRNKIEASQAKQRKRARAKIKAYAASDGMGGDRV
ncbi:MAG: DUF2062 domain-containing protein [Pseudomonadota bacterium]